MKMLINKSLNIKIYTLILNPNIPMLLQSEKDTLSIYHF
jgi:hypothetical protein